MLYFIIGLCVLLYIVIWIFMSNLDLPEISRRQPLTRYVRWVMSGSRGLYGVIRRISMEALEKDGVLYLGFSKLYGLYGFIRRISMEALEKDGVLYLGFSKLYVIADPEDSLTILNSCIQKHYTYDFLKPICGNGILTTDLHTWKIHRKLLNPAFNQQVLIGFMDMFNSQANNLVNRFASNLNIKFDHEKILGINGLETICLTATGVDADEYGNLQKQFLTCFRTLMQLCTERQIKFWLHSDYIYNWSSLRKKIDKEIKILMTLSNSILQKKKSQMKKSTYIENKSEKFKPFIDLILELSNNNSSFTDEQILAEINTIIAAGHDTSSTTLAIALKLLGSNPAVQEKAYKEILEVFGNTERDVNQEDLPKLVYIEAILKETLRLHSVAPVVARRLERDVKLRNFTLKANSGCLISIFGIHRHKMWGTDAEEFKPERWLDKDTLPDQKYFAAFGLGRRSCIGKTYAMMSMKINLVHILRRYRISSDSTKMVLQMNILLRPSSGFYISLEQRNVKQTTKK